MEEKIFEARMRLLMKQWPTIWGGNLIIQALCAVILWPFFPHLTVILWCVCNYILFAYRLWMKKSFESSIRAGHAALSRWSRKYVFSAIVGGAIWGGASWLFFDSINSEITLLMLLVLVGLCSGALPALSSFSPAFIAFISALLLPTALCLAMFDGFLANWAAIFTLIFLVINVIYSRQLDRTISQSITVDLRNRSLLEEYSAARDMAEKANHSKSTFLANVSHDLRQPLHAMGLFMDSLRGQLTETKQKATFESIQIAHDSLIHIFDALLEISRLESGSVKPIITHFSLPPLLHDLKNNFMPLARKKHLSFEVTCEDKIAVHSDKVLLFTILSNLLSNAIKYTQNGSITIRCDKLNEHVIIQIKDTGFGIPEDSYERIFFEYQQLDNPERDISQGLGLGLSIVKRTCRLLGLTLTLSSVYGKGSTFTLTLPESQKHPHLDSQSKGHDHLLLKGLHVMMIEDNMAIREGTEALLNRWGCLVTSCESCYQALIDIADKERPVDIMICDYRLRDNKTGIEAISEFRTSIDSELPAILITGDTDPQLHAQLKRDGQCILHKPFRAEQLKKAIIKLTK